MGLRWTAECRSRRRELSFGFATRPEATELRHNKKNIAKAVDYYKIKNNFGSFALTFQSINKFTLGNRGWRTELGVCNAGKISSKSGIRNRLLAFQFVSCGIPMPPRVLSDLEYAATLLHTIYPYPNALLLALVGIKYQALNTSPFIQHPAVIILFLIATTVYVIALLVLTFRSNLQINLIIMVWVCHICGSVVCELLLLVLVSPIWCFLINLSSLVLVLTLLFSYNYRFQPSHPNDPQTQTAEGQPIEVEDKCYGLKSCHNLKNYHNIVAANSHPSNVRNRVDRIRYLFRPSKVLAVYQEEEGKMKKAVNQAKRRLKDAQREVGFAADGQLATERRLAALGSEEAPAELGVLVMEYEFAQQALEGRMKEADATASEVAALELALAEVRSRKAGRA
ncbi:hypothetical protein K1719_014281 [Acacia pycnantha]|nr:hypothetical protein K1719_014281 [Acacia pycnantha]